eukprot:1952872-Rhodomonas_salina.1
MPEWVQLAMETRRFRMQPHPYVPLVTTWLPVQRHAAPILPLPLTWSDWEWYVRRLPRRKAGGEDGVTYELVQEAPLRLQQVILDGVNAMLAGQALPPHWKGGVIQLLTKRDPNSQIENLRPVTLLQVAYKLFTSVVANRLSHEMEGAGMLEDSQHGFRPHKQTRQPVAVLQHMITESKRQGSRLVVAYLDWFSAFCSLSLEKLYSCLVTLGLHPSVDTLHKAHSGAWVKVRTPFGDTAEIEVTRGSQQGDCLSQSLFVFFVNLCLRHLEGTGVGFTHQCGLRRNTTCFADDVALCTSSVEDMQVLLDCVKEFCYWSGVAKCEVTGYDFGTRTEIPTNALTFGTASLTRLSPHTAFKYLGLQMSLTGSTRAEK